jgi:hypothetical protein
MYRPTYVVSPHCKSPRYPLNRKRMGPGTDVYNMEKRRITVLPGLELRSLGRESCNQSPYRLSYPGSSAIYFGLKVITVSRVITSIVTVWLLCSVVSVLSIRQTGVSLLVASCDIINTTESPNK